MGDQRLSQRHYIVASLANFFAFLLLSATINTPAWLLTEKVTKEGVVINRYIDLQGDIRHEETMPSGLVTVIEARCGESSDIVCTASYESECERENVSKEFCATCYACQKANKATLAFICVALTTAFFAFLIAALGADSRLSAEGNWAILGSWNSFFSLFTSAAASILYGATLGPRMHNPTEEANYSVYIGYSYILLIIGSGFSLVSALLMVYSRGTLKDEHRIDKMNSNLMADHEEWDGTEAEEVVL